MTTAIEVVDLVKTYGQQRAVDGLNLSVPAGAVFGLLGPNGAGKSTTFGAVCGWLRPTSGHCAVLGTPSDRLHELRGRVAALPQDARFPDAAPVSVQLAHYGRLLGLSRNDSRIEASRVLELVGLTEAASKRGNQMSHGMAKRVGIAQSLIGRPSVVLLDEPTAGLDPHNARGIRDLISSLAPDATVVVSSHNLDEIEDICTHGAIIDRGRLVTSGAIHELTRQAGEAVIETRPGVQLPAAALEAAFGAANVTARDGAVHLRHGAGGDGGEPISRALRILLDAEVPVLGVRRGRSLEAAFLELTNAGSP
ncbi:MAG: ABC transporter ATP-binding protein [Myxococcales bacterium]|nr:ABC transporter ATP-binding protein [Myxococcales bacterium]